MADKNIDKFNPKSIVKVSSQLYEMDKRRIDLSIYGYRLLYAISSGLSERDMFCEYRFSKSALIKYLNIDNTNQRHDILQQTLTEVQSKGISIVTTNRGKRTWENISLITYSKHSEDGDSVIIHINDKAMDILFNIKQYVPIMPKHYLPLTTTYQNWFYPFLKKSLKLGTWTMTIDDIITGLNLDGSATPKGQKKPDNTCSSYDRNKCASYIGNVLRFVVGIEPSQAYKEEIRAAKAEKRKPRPVPWDYYKNPRSGNPTGTLYTISHYTDIEVKAYAEKEGRSYARVVFLVRQKVSEMDKRQLSELDKNIKKQAEEDMGSRQDLSNRVGTESIPYAQIVEPACEVPVMEAAFHDEQELRDSAREVGMTFEEYVEMGRFAKHPNGKWYRR